MAVKVINPNKLKKVLSVASADKALLDVGKKVKSELLHNIDEDYLNKYTPEEYKRTDRLKDSTGISSPYNSNNIRKVDIGFLEENDYEYHSKFTGEFAWSNMSKGFHGSDSPKVPYTLTDKMKTEPNPLDTTRDWVEKNATELLKKSLQSQGYNIK